MNTRPRLWERLYIPIAIILIAFGVLAMFSIGLPFFVLGLALILLWPLRHRRPLFGSLVLGVFVFVVVGILVAPLGCKATATPPGTAGRTTCDNMLGIPYQGRSPYNPPLWPAPMIGAAAGAIAAGVTYVIRRRCLGTEQSAYSPPITRRDGPPLDQDPTRGVDPPARESD